MTDIAQAVAQARALRELVEKVDPNDGTLPQVRDVIMFENAAINDAPLLCDAVEELAGEVERLRDAAADVIALPLIDARLGAAIDHLRAALAERRK